MSDRLGRFFTTEADDFVFHDAEDEEGPLSEATLADLVEAEQLQALLGGETVEESRRKEGETWQGPSGRWFTLSDGRVVPAHAPSGPDDEKKAGREAGAEQRAAHAAADADVKDAAAAVHLHARQADALHDQLYALHWDDPAVQKAADVLFEMSKDKFDVPSTLFPGSRSGEFGRWYDKQLSHRKAEFVELDRLASAALDRYATLPPFEDEDQQAQRGQVAQALRQARLLAARGLKLIDAVRAAKGERARVRPD